MIAQGLQLQFADVATVDGHGPGGDVIEARQQRQDGRLAAARRADQGDGLARRDVQADVRQGRRAAFFAGLIGEGDVVQGDGDRAGLQFDGVGRLADFRLDIQGGEQTTGGGQAFAEDGGQVGHLTQGLPRQQQHADEGGEGPDRHLTLAGAPTRIGHDGGDDAVGDDVAGWAGEGAAVGALDDVALATGDDLADAGLFGGLAVLDLDDADAVQVLHQGAGQGLGLDHGAACGLARLLAEAADDPADHRHAQQDDQREGQVDEAHGDDDAQQHQGVLGVVDHARGEGFAHQVGVEQDGRDEAARMLAAQPRQVGPDHAREQLLLDVADDAVTEAVHQGRLRRHGQRPDHRHYNDEQRDEDQHLVRRNGDQAPDLNRPFVLGEQQVDRRFQELQQQGGQPARNRRAEHGGEEGRLVPGQVVAPDPAQKRPQRFAGVGCGRGNGHWLSVERDGRQVKPPPSS
ncbi:hypothetical protein D3C87_1235800 [compost metagenome]